MIASHSTIADLGTPGSLLAFSPLSKDRTSARVFWYVVDRLTRSTRLVTDIVAEL